MTTLEILNQNQMSQDARIQALEEQVTTLGRQLDRALALMERTLGDLEALAKVVGDVVAAASEEA